MQIAREIRGIKAMLAGRKLRDKNWKAYKIDFATDYGGKPTAIAKKKLSRDEAARAAIARWAGVLGVRTK